MLEYVQSITLHAANGRIWAVKPTKPAAGHSGLAVVFQLPGKAVNGGEVRSQSFACAAFDDKGEYLAAVDRPGHVWCFNLAQNRYVKLDTTGSPGTCAAFSFTGFSTKILFVGFQDGSVRAYDIVKSTPLGILREHRNAPRHISIRTCSGELLTTSIDGAILWDGKKLQRKRCLGSGPYGALKAAFTADEEFLVTGFQDGSFYVWTAKAFDLVRSFQLPYAPQLRMLQRTFALSPDGELLVSAGLKMPVLLVYHLLSGELRHAIALPDPETVTGASQVEFLPDGATLAAMCSDGSVRFIDVKQGAVVAEVPNIFPNRKEDCSFSMDKAANSMSVVSNGKVCASEEEGVVLEYSKVLLYDLAALRRSAGPPRPLQIVQPADLEAAYMQLPMRIAGVLADSDQQQDATGHRGDQGGGSRPRPEICFVDGSASAPHAAARTRSSTAQAQEQQKGKAGKPVAAGSKAAAAGVGGAQQPGLQIKGRMEEAQVTLNRQRLTALLEQFGEYPAKYRLLIWGFLLRLPRNNIAFQLLVNRGLHPAYADMESRFPLQNKALITRLSHALSQLAHWCPVFAEAGFMPGLVFPFVKMHAAGSTAASNESCFELLATVLINWTRGWFERFPDPPLGILARLDALLTFHDAPLATHLRSTCQGGIASMAWSIMQDLLTGVLAKEDWLKLWDHCFTAGPDYLYYFIVALFMSLRTTLLGLDTEFKVSSYMGKPPTINTNRVLRVAYELRLRTPPEVRPALPDWDPLPATGNYTDFKDYPAAAVELFAQERKKIAEAEEALARRRKVVSELQLRSKAVALQTKTLAEEREALSALQQERREQLRQVEAAMLAEMQKLEDKAKEEKLKQVATIERAQQAALAGMRSEWQRELGNLREDLVARRHLMSAQVQSKAEEETIAQLEFAARAKLSALEQEAAQQATLSKMRDEAQARAAELEAKKAAKMREWEMAEEARRLRAQHEDARRRRLTQAAEDAAAQAAVRKELLAAQLAMEDQMMKVDAERRLRELAEEQATITAQVVETEAAKAAARAAADEQALALQAEADAAWFAAEAQRREALLAAERDTLKAAEQVARHKLEETEAALRLAGGQAALLERRRTMEAVNAEEEVQARRVLDAIAVERARAALLVEELSGREEALTALLARAQHASTLQREEDSPEGVALHAARTALAAAQQQDLDALRRLHASNLERLSRERDEAEVQLGPAGRNALRERELGALKEHVAALEARRRELESVLGIPPRAPAAPAYVPPAPPAPAWAAPQPPARDNVYGPGPAEPLPTGLGGQGRQQPRPSTSSSFAASSSVTSSLGPTPAATPGGPHTSFLPPASTASTPASFSPPAPSLPALSPEQLQGGARGFLPSWAAASQGPDHEGLDVSVPGARASTATVREAQARGWDNQGLHLSTGDPDYGEFDLRGVLQELDMGLGRRPPVAGRRATGTSTGSPSPATSPTGHLMPETGAMAELLADSDPAFPASPTTHSQGVYSSGPSLAPPPAVGAAREEISLSGGMLPMPSLGSSRAAATSSAASEVSLRSHSLTSVTTTTTTTTNTAPQARAPTAGPAAAAGAAVAARPASSTLSASGLSASSGFGYGRVGAQVVATTSATSTSMGLTRSQGSVGIARSGPAANRAASSNAAAAADTDEEVESRVRPDTGTAGGMAAIARERAREAQGQGSAPDPMRELLLAGPWRGGAAAGGTQAAAAGHGGSAHATGLEPPSSPEPSSPGEVSDLDGLISRLRRDLDLTETESSMSEIAALSSVMTSPGADSYYGGGAGARGMYTPAESPAPSGPYSGYSLRAEVASGRAGSTDLHSRGGSGGSGSGDGVRSGVGGITATTLAGLGAATAAAAGSTAFDATPISNGSRPSVASGLGGRASSGIGTEQGGAGAGSHTGVASTGRGAVGLGAGAGSVQGSGWSSHVSSTAGSPRAASGTAGTGEGAGLGPSAGGSGSGNGRPSWAQALQELQSSLGPGPGELQEVADPSP